MFNSPAATLPAGDLGIVAEESTVTGSAPTPETIRQARLRLLQMHFEAGVGHIGGNLSALDAMLVLFHQAMQPGDDFVLSKGHSAGALYVSLWSIGRIPEASLKTFHKDGTLLSGHPPANVYAEMPHGTGSLGHGLSTAAGLALGRKLAGKDGRVFCLTSDGEWDEGSTWEALIFIGHHQLENLTFIIDLNGLQGFGSTKEVADLGKLKPILDHFKIKAIEVDGHDIAALSRAMLDPTPGPRAIIANTRKGSGVSFMENKMEWHYLPLKAEQYELAVREIMAHA